MRKTLIIPSFIFLSLSGVLLLSQNIDYQKALASSYSTRDVPTTIDLNDTSASNIRSYYSGLSSLSSSERQGTNLLKNLKPILKNNQKYYSYGSSATTAVWQAYEIVDRDWEMSPASEISGYNSSTKIITGYTYGKSNSNVGTNPYIHALYVNRNVTNQTRAWGNHNQDDWGINQEHVWAKSAGFDDDSHGVGARGDLMHLWAGNGRVNGQFHSNYYYGYVDQTKTFTDAGKDSKNYTNLTGNLKGFSRTFGENNSVFEPQDCDKGDIARSIFYMAARYNYYSGSDSDGIDAGNPNLELVNNVTSWSNSGYTSSTSSTGKMGILQDLLEWNRLDPPDEWEIHRNNILYNNYTLNRNPFIDFPQWAEYIWGKSEDGTYNSSSTGYATPASDRINGFSDVTPVSSVSLNKASTSLQVGGTETLTAAINPDNATNQNVTWSSSKTSVATVSNGTITAVGVGSATITVTTEDGGKTASCTVTVTSSGSSSSTTSATLYSGVLTEGDYVIYYDGKALKNTVDSGTGRFDYSEVTPTNDTISEPDANIVWHIAPSGDNWTIYNSTVAKYAAGTGVKNKGSLIPANDANNSALWTASGTSTYEFVNKRNSDAGVNSYLRNNGTYGFACYSTSTGGALSLYKVEEVLVPTSIYASVEKTYKVGETISKSDITVVDNNGTTINNFTFTNDRYQFRYSDASSGGALTDKVFAISYDTFETTLTVKVSREAYVPLEENAIEITPSDFIDVEVSDSSGSPSTGTFTLAGTELYLNGVYVYNKSSISLSSGKYSAPGYFYNSEPLEEDIVSLSVGKNDSSPTPNIAVSADGSNWLDLSSVNTAKVSYRYFKIYYSNTDVSTYTNLTSIVINTITHQSAVNVANFIMYEDTNNQCLTKFDVAKDYFNNMTTAEKATFMTSEDYVIATARARLQAWATNQGKEIIVDDGEYVINPSSKALSHVTSNSGNSIVLIVALSFISMISMYAFIEKKKQEE